MSADERRERILEQLGIASKPVSATRLAGEFGVSRQIIVGDIALLRAAGSAIAATPRGYVLEQGHETENAANSYVLACRHDKSSLEAELYTIIDNGGTLLNVSVEHPIYGVITQELNIRSRFDADTLLKKVAVSGASLLCGLTNGIHMHSIICPNPETYRRILVSLKQQGVLHTQ